MSVIPENKMFDSNSLREYTIKKCNINLKYPLYRDSLSKQQDRVC